MTTLITIIGFTVLISLAAAIYLKISSQKGPDESFINLKEENARLRAEKDEMAGKGKHLYADNVQMKEEKKSLEKERDQAQKRISKFEAEELQREEIFAQKINKLEAAEKALEDEKVRIRREDEERIAKELEDRDRMWNEHEQNVVSLIGDLCKLPEYNFQTFDNKTLPEKFDGSFKPDCMVEFLGQYVIFDAKASRSDNLQTYIQTQVKSTVTKVKKNSQIYRTIYLVIPTTDIVTLKKTYYFEGGYAFFIISPDSIPPILAALKKITNYELAQEMDPQERENIVNMIAEFDDHIHMRNAADLLLAQIGVGVLDKAKQLDSGIQEEINTKKNSMRQVNLQPGELKRLKMNTTVQQESIDKLVSPQVPIPEKQLGTAARLLSKKSIGK